MVKLGLSVPEVLWETERKTFCLLVSSSCPCLQMRYIVGVLFNWNEIKKPTFDEGEEATLSLFPAAISHVPVVPPGGGIHETQGLPSPPPFLQKNLYPYGTAIFAVTCVLFWIYLYIYLPETRGRSVEDVTEEFRRKVGEAPSRETDRTVF